MTISSCCREGRHFCKLTIIGDCSIKYKALRNMEIFLRGKFLANSNYIVSSDSHNLTFLPFSHSYNTVQVHVAEDIVDSSLQNDLLFLLHEYSVSVYDLSSRTWRENILIAASKLVAIEVNDHVIVVMDTSNTLHILQRKG